MMEQPSGCGGRSRAEGEREEPCGEQSAGSLRGRRYEGAAGVAGRAWVCWVCFININERGFVLLL